MAVYFVVPTRLLLSMNGISVNNYTGTPDTNQNHPRPTGTRGHPSRRAQGEETSSVRSSSMQPANRILFQGHTTHSSPALELVLPHSRQPRDFLAPGLPRRLSW